MGVLNYNYSVIKLDEVRGRLEAGKIIRSFFYIVCRPFSKNEMRYKEKKKRIHEPY